MRRHFFFYFLQVFVAPALLAQQIPDFDFDPRLARTAYPKVTGNVILVDEAHHNFHKISTRYAAFAHILSKDGYQLQPNTKPFAVKELKKAKILVIANAVHESDTTDWILPNPSAFTPKEIDEVVKWVQEGGSLFLIADHMPMPGAADDLAKRFGFTFYNGFATDTTAGLFPGSKKELDIFQKDDGTLGHHSITHGIESVASFTGQAFQIPHHATSLLTFNDHYKVLLPDTAWKFSQSTKRLPVKGFSQGAVLSFGKGRVAVFGEAAMFTAQRKGKDKIPFGLNSEEAPHNLPFLLNLVHWLDRK